MHGEEDSSVNCKNLPDELFFRIQRAGDRLQGWLGHSKNGQTRKWVWSFCNVCNQLLMGANY